MGVTLLVYEAIATLVCTLPEATRPAVAPADAFIDGAAVLGITTGGAASDVAMAVVDETVKLAGAAEVVVGATVFSTPTPSVGRGNGLPLTSQTPAVNAGQGGGVFDGI